MNTFFYNIIKQIGINHICIIATIFSVILIFNDGVLLDFDTISYIKAWNSFRSGEIDLWRTPTYPIILGFLKCCFGDKYYLFATIVIQHIVFLISIIFFYRISIRITGNKYISLFITSFYALFPCFPTWNNYILTESFAVSGIVLLLYFMITIYVDHSANTGKFLFLFSLLLLLLIFLRPALLFIVPILLLILLILGIRRSWEKSIYYGLTSILLICSSLFGYMYLYQKKYGLFTPTAVGVLNNYYIARMEGTINPDLSTNKELSNYITNSIILHGVKYSGGTGTDLGREGITAIRNYGPKSVSELIDASDYNNLNEKVKRFFHHLHRASQDKLFSTYNQRWESFSNFTCLRFNILYFLLFAYPIIITIWMVKRKTFAWFSLFLFLLGTGHLFVILYSCPMVWYRLIIPFAPIYLLMVGQIANLLKIKEAHNQFLL